jgi:hypothetical protein
MARELQAWNRSRPLRVAFLVEDGQHAHLALDGIFADCYGRWGGRFSLIAPCINERIAPNYWPWLEAYDPDIVYSYVSLSPADVLEIHERLCPSQYFCHKSNGEPRLDVFGFKPSYGFEPLAVMETGAGPAAQLDQARRQLTDDGIKFELLTPDQYSAQDDPYLPSE